MYGRPAGRPSGPPHSAAARQDLRAEYRAHRCFLHGMPLLPGHNLALEQKEESQKGRWATSPLHLTPPAVPDYNGAS
jgi:hypothetical protein